jgi:ASPIC and UnbV/FG-GAP-like repeat
VERVFSKGCPLRIFEDATAMLAENPPSLSRGVTLFDLDGQGDPEIFVANLGTGNFLFKHNRADGRFVQQAPSGFLQPELHTWSYVPADFLGGGVPCVYAVQSEVERGIKKHRDDLWIRKAPIVGSDKKPQQCFAFDNLTDSFPVLRHPYAARSVIGLDLKGTGQHSYLVSGFGAPSLQFSYDTSENRVKDSHFFVGSQSRDSDLRILGAQSIASHNSVDVVASGEKGSVSLFAKTRSGQLRDIGFSIGLGNVGSDVQGLTMADLDGNGRIDLLLTSFSNHPRVFSQSTDRVFLDQTPFGLATGLIENGLIHPGCGSCVVADFDNDGLDEVWFSYCKGPNRLFRYLGVNGWEELKLGPCEFELFEGSGAAVGDLDGDGFLELVVANGQNKPQINNVMKPYTNKNGWLRVLPLTRAGFPALGARVRVHSKKTPRPWQMRLIGAGDGCYSFSEPVAHFGLGPEGEVIAVEVFWPGNGTGIPYTRLEAPIQTNQTVTLYPPASFSM